MELKANPSTFHVRILLSTLKNSQPSGMEYPHQQISWFWAVNHLPRLLKFIFLLGTFPQLAILRSSCHFKKIFFSPTSNCPPLMTCIRQIFIIIEIFIFLRLQYLVMTSRLIHPAQPTFIDLVLLLPGLFCVLVPLLYSRCHLVC